MNSHLTALLTKQIGQQECLALMNLVQIPTQFTIWEEAKVTRIELAQAMNMLLFKGVLDRVPSGRKYTEETAAQGGKVMLDHGALRTVRWFGIGELPPGEAAITRVLKPLGYRLNGTFPLDRLKMTGRSYAHLDDADNISQFFVSELHPECFSPEFQAAVTRVLGESKDPLTPQAVSWLNELERDGYVSMTIAHELLPIIVSCFERQHGVIAESDYQILLNESKEMAWIATEGNVFNHATDRVADVFATSDALKALGRPIKEEVEVSKSGRVKQTAFKADPVQREMRDANGNIVVREVPGSFYEFITRDTYVDETGATRLDLGFDTSNAQAIFKMTANA